MTESPPTTPRTDEARAELIAAARAAAAGLAAEDDGVRLTLARFARASGISKYRVQTVFGNWGALCAAAGLEPTLWRTRVPDEDIFIALRDHFKAHGGIGTRNRFERGFRYSENIISRRWGSWDAVLAAFGEWARENEPDFPHIPPPPPARRGGRVLAAERGAATGSQISHAPLGPHDPLGLHAPLESKSGPRAARAGGAPLGFRALAYAPVNEQGVVLLFGMVAGELGYVIETVATGFPDCTARRRVSGERWEPVRIEFEFRSKSFALHGHDPAGCDVVVCWRHDWPDCPLEVLELEPVLADLA